MRPGVLLALAVLASPLSARNLSVYEEDVRFGLTEIQSRCAALIERKQIDWKSVSREFTKEAKKVKTDPEHLVLLHRLLARLEDGHAAVRPLEKGKDVEWPQDLFGRKRGPGMFLCRVGKKGRILVKTSWNASGAAGIEPGMEILRVNGKPASKWLEARVEASRHLLSFSTEQQAFYHACHKGLVGPTEERLKLELRDVKGKRHKKTVSFGKANQVQWGPAFFPEGCERHQDVTYGKTARGWGYLHIRRCKGDLPDQVDVALAGLGKIPGLILDFRGNTGGAFDHAALFGRFVPAGRTYEFGTRRYASQGDHPFGGPVVVIVDAGVASAGETGSGMLKEHGRAFMIGETRTAGMSSQKTTIELPSGLFALYVSIGSNMASFNEGRGIEGIGVVPHEIVEYDPRDLARKEDTLILAAEKILKRFPADQVPFHSTGLAE